MDVIGNNISNVNTVGFKASTVTFSDVLYQKSSSASGPSATTGKTGVNAKQIGLGAGLASIQAAMTTSGGSQRTDNPFDIMIEGEGFFIVNDGSGNVFTKAGNFTVDANGTLCNSNGYAVMGWQVDPNDPRKAVADTVSELRVMAPENLYVEPEPTRNVYFTGNIDYKDTQLTTDTGKMTTLSFYDNL
jgi:flagellar hook protein FlgE